MPAAQATASVAPCWPNRTAAQISAGNTRNARGRLLDSSSSLSPTTAAIIAATSSVRPARQAGGCAQARISGRTIERARGVSEPERAPHAGELMAVNDAVGEQRQRADGGADRDGGSDRDEHPADLIETVELCAPADQPPQQQRRDEDLGEVGRRDREGGAERSRPGVREQIADHGAGPPAQAAQVQHPDRQANGRPDRGDRAGELQGISALAPPRSRRRPGRPRPRRSGPPPEVRSERSTRAEPPGGREAREWTSDPPERAAGTG